MGEGREREGAAAEALAELGSKATAVKALESGKVYVIEYDGLLSAEQHRLVQADLRAIGDRVGVQFLLLEGGLRVVGPVEVAPADDPACPEG